MLIVPLGGGFVLPDGPKSISPLGSSQLGLGSWGKPTPGLLFPSPCPPKKQGGDVLWHPPLLATIPLLQPHPSPFLGALGKAHQHPLEGSLQPFDSLCCCPKPPKPPGGGVNSG